MSASNPEKTTPSPETIEQLAKAKTMIQSTLGQVVLAMAAVPRYRNHTLSDISHLIIDPLSRDRIAIAHASSGEDDGRDQLSPPAIAIWASVSDEADARIQEQVKAGVFPIRLKPADWASGEHVWLLDVIAPNRTLATAVLTSFGKITKRDNVKIHPVVRGLVDQDVLKKLVEGASVARTGAANVGALN